MIIFREMFQRKIHNIQISELFEKKGPIGCPIGLYQGLIG